MYASCSSRLETARLRLWMAIMSDFILENFRMAVYQSKFMTELLGVVTLSEEIETTVIFYLTTRTTNKIIYKRFQYIHIQFCYVVLFFVNMAHYFKKT